MGWDAFATQNGETLFSFNEERGELEIADPVLCSIFAEVSKEVVTRTGAVDFLLRCGGLDCSACAHMLERATKCTAWDGDGWVAEQVQMLARTADWDFDYSANDAWAYWSARRFLETCARYKLGIKFSW